MFYSDKEINTELDEMKIESQVFFTSMLPSFIWDRISKAVVPYASNPSHKTDLIVIETDLIKFDKEGSLKDYLEKQELTPKNILIFCVNPQFFPSSAKAEDSEEKWVRVKILK